MHNQIVVRPALSSDVPVLVKIHLRAFQGFFLTFLGSAFLREMYAAIIADYSGIGFIIENYGIVTGFVVGTVQPVGFYRRLLRQRWWRFAIATIKPVLNRPTILPRLLRAFSIPATVSQIERRGTLMSIAILPDVQGKGVGKKLIYAFLQEATNRGLRQVDLTTDRYHNEAANYFYQRLGFVCTRSFTTPEGRVMNEYVIDLQTYNARTLTKSHVSILPQGEYIA